MKRRDFTAGVIAAGAAGPALASKEQPELPTHLRIQIALRPGGRLVRVDRIMFIGQGGVAQVFDTTRKFRYRNEDRVVIRGLSAPRLIDEAVKAEFLAKVHFAAGTLAMDFTLKRRVDTTLRIGDEDTTFILGALKRLKDTETRKVPVLGDIPHVGSLFRSAKSDNRKQDLMIMVTPKILRES